MMRFHKQLAELTLLGVMTLAGVMLHREVQGEPAGCISNLCKSIFYYYDCDSQQGVVLQYLDCLSCYSGRCQGGAASVICQDSDIPQEITTADVTPTCDCSKLFWPDHTVEATGTVTGMFKQSAENRWLCPGGS